MGDTLKHRQSISPAKRKLLSLLLKDQGITTPEQETIQRTGMVENLPLSFSQQRLFFLDRLAAGTSPYNIAGVARLKGPLHINSFQQSFHKIIQRHEILHTTFAFVDEQPRQTIVTTMPKILQIIDLSLLVAPALEGEVLRLAYEEAHQPFDLASGPLIRATLLRLKSTEHVLLITMHHIVSDGWSISIFVRELANFYATYEQGKTFSLPELPIQYADYALWQRNHLQKEALETEVSYWKGQLADAPMVLDLPSDRPRPAVQTFRGAKYRFTLPIILVDALQALSTAEGTTLFITLLAAYNVLLFRYTGQYDILVGSPIANRNKKEIEGLIGCFVNNIVLHTNLSNNPSFQELLQQVRRVCLMAYEHQDLPFDLLVKEMLSERNLHYNPLFQVAFVLQNTPRTLGKMANLDIEIPDFDNGTARFDLTLNLEDVQNGAMQGWFEYSSALFDEVTIARMTSHWLILLEGIVTDPRRTIADLPLLTLDERQHLLVEWNATRTLYPKDVGIQQIFEAHVERAPERIAAVFADHSITYQELNTRANQVAYALRQSGVKLEARVGICVERTLDLIIGLLGIVKAGGAYVPLDPSYPAERLAFIVQDTQAVGLLLQQRFAKNFSDYTGFVICLDSGQAGIDDNQRDNLENWSQGANLAYVMYTSGSTGQPKGINITHSAICRLVHNTNYVQFQIDDTVAQVANSSFDAATFEIWGPLLNGAKMVGIPKDIVLAPSAFATRLHEQAITTLFLTTALFNQLANDTPYAFSSLRHLLFGGEAVNPQQVAKVLHDGAPQRLLHVYGPTESTTYASWHLVHEVPNGATTVPIGKPLTNTELYVLDDYLSLVPVGVPGELYIGGDGLSRGYLNHPDLTAACFIPHPFTREPGCRLYKTGDRVRYRVDGVLEFLGRRDHQIKLRGFRIELGEIEVQLKQHISVRETLVLLNEDEIGNKQLIAYVVLKKDAVIPTFELREFLKERLPDYMIPAVYVPLVDFPLSPNGKIDHHSLPLPDRSLSSSTDESTQPHTLVEKALCDIWSQVMGIENIGIHDNFFELGGDSILSIQVCALARERKLDLSLQQLFEYSTIYELAKEISISDLITPSSQHKAFFLISSEDMQRIPTHIEDAYPLTTLQSGMLFYSEDNPNTHIYHDVFSFHIQGPADHQQLQSAIEQLIVKHPILRTSFDITNFSQPLQLVHKKIEVIPLEWEDIGHLSASQQEECISSWFEEEKSKPFDKASAPLMRMKLHLHSQETFQFSISLHHVIIDGWSLASLLTELFTLYFSLLGHGSYSMRKPLRSTFRDFVLLEMEAIKSEQCQQYWEKKLRNCTFTQLPRHPLIQQSSVSRHTRTGDIEIPQDLFEALKHLAERLDVPLKSVLLAAHIRVLSLISNQTDVLTGLVSNGRPEDADGERVLGLFLNTLPFRVNISGGNWIDLIQEVFAIEQELLPFRRYPMSHMPHRKTGQPLFETMFNFIHFHVMQAMFEIPDVKLLTTKEFTETDLSMAVSFIVDTSLSTLRLHIECDTSIVLYEERITSLGQYYTKALSTMVKQPQSRYEAFSLLSQKERQQLLAYGGKAMSSLPRGTYGVHELFEQQVIQMPDAVALICGQEYLTYERLNAKANQLAQYLCLLGVRPEVPIGICMRRSVEMIVAILAILKAGGAYVPLDPNYPRERLIFQLQDVRASVVVTEQSLAPFLSLTDVPSLQIICVDSDWSLINAQSQKNLSSIGSSDYLAYIIYTSGSTGKPKGVGIVHRSTIALLRWVQTAFDVTELFGVLASTSICFDLSIFEIFAPLSWGGSVILVENALQLVQQPPVYPITLLNTVPSVLTMLIRNKAVPEAVQVINLAGEALTRNLVLDAYRYTSAERVCNLYGPTEDTTYSTWITLPRESLGEIPIGRPIFNTQVYILDTHLQPVPIGVQGELYLGGEGLARGYIHQPDFTAERFIPNPFSFEAGARLYKTGDLVRYRADGMLDYLGRSDNQVKIRGFRIELGEIEALLIEHPTVQEAALVVSNDDDANKSLVAYIVPTKSGTIFKNELQAFLKMNLPEYMIPAAFVPLEALPLSLTGKVNRKHLLEFEAQRLRQDTRIVTPRTPLETALAEIWQYVLRIQSVGIHDNFFASGGDSLLATQIVSQIRTRLLVECPLVLLFQEPTIAGLAASLERNRTSSKLADQSIERVAREGALPLSFAQQRLWFFEQLEPGGVIYNIPLAIHLQGSLQRNLLEKSLNAVVKRHESLRTTFVEREGQPVQVIAPEQRVALILIDLAGLDSVARTNALEVLSAQEAQISFDLTRGPLMRCALVQLEAQKYTFLLTMHHIISDGWSQGILVQELTEFYTAFLKGEPADLEILPIQYADFAVWQRKWLQGAVLEEQLQYWRKQLAHVPPLLRLPVDSSQEQVPTSRGARYAMTISRSLADSLHIASNQENVTLFMMLLASFNVLLFYYSEQDDIVVGSPTANRTHSELEKLIGFFINMLALRTDLSGNPTFRELLTRVRETTLAAYAHQNLPFEKLVESFYTERSLGMRPFFRVIFTLQNVYIPPVELPHLSVHAQAIDQGTTKSDIQLAISETEQGLELNFVYNVELFEKATIVKIAQQFEILLTAILDQIDARLSDLLITLTQREYERQHRKQQEREAKNFLRIKQVKRSIHEKMEKQKGKE